MNLRFDDRLATSLGQDDSRPRLRAVKWVQLADLVAQLGGDDQGPLADAYAFLRSHHGEMPAETLGRLRRSLRGRPVPAALQPLLAPPAPQPPLHLADQPRNGSEAVDGRPARLNGHGSTGKPALFETAPRALEPESDGAVVRPIFFRPPDPEGAPPAKRHRGVRIEPLDPVRRDAAKAAFTTRRVPQSEMRTLVSGSVRPQTGDLVLARVDRILYHSRLELAGGRKAALHVGDEIIVAYGDRYATDQFEAEVPRDLKPTNLIATGGVASSLVSKTAGVRSPSEITPIGLVGDAAGRPLNLRHFALRPVSARAPRPRTVAVFGTSMNSGKTTTNRYLVAGLSRAGLRPGAVKITGTGSGGDFWVMQDAGAHCVLDFTDAGYSSTYKVPVADLEAATSLLLDHMTAAGCGIILVEIADGLFQEQNAELIRSPFFRSIIDGAFFAAGEAMGAERGVGELRAVGIPVLGVSGKLTGSELLVREAERVCGAPILFKSQLADPELAPRLVGLEAARPAAPEPHPRVAPAGPVFADSPGLKQDLR